MFNADVYDVGEEFYSPSFGYPPQRIGSYDNILTGHITLNGVSGGGVQPMSKQIAPQRNYHEKATPMRGLAGHGESWEKRKDWKRRRVLGY